MSNASMRAENAAHLGAVLAGRLSNTPGANLSEPTSETVLRLQKAARIVHRNDERRCNEDLTCPECDGRGYTVNKSNGARNGMDEDCERCGGSGDTIGKRERNMLEKVRAALSPYGVRLYEQGDPRGWPLYLIPDIHPSAEDGSYYSARGVAVCPH